MFAHSPKEPPKSWSVFGTQSKTRYSNGLPNTKAVQDKNLRRHPPARAVSLAQIAGISLGVLFLLLGLTQLDLLTEQKSRHVSRLSVSDPLLKVTNF